MATLETGEFFNLQYPTGKFLGKEEYTMDQTQHSMDRLEKLPGLYIELTGTIKNRLENRYRKEGWTGLQGS